MTQISFLRNFSALSNFVLIFCVILVYIVFVCLLAWALECLLCMAWTWDERTDWLTYTFIEVRVIWHSCHFMKELSLECLWCGTFKIMFSLQFRRSFVFFLFWKATREELCYRRHIDRYTYILEIGLDTIFWFCFRFWLKVFCRRSSFKNNNNNNKNPIDYVCILGFHFYTIENIEGNLISFCFVLLFFVFAAPLVSVLFLVCILLYEYSLKMMFIIWDDKTP